VVPTFSLGAASNYALLFEGGGTGNTLQVVNARTNIVGSGLNQGNGIGNIGVGGAGKANVGGPSNINGSIDFSAANTGQLTLNGSNTITGGVNYGVSAVTSALNTVNALNSTLGALPGTSIAINGNTTINAASGTFSASGAGYTNARVFTVSSFLLNNGQAITINGNGTDSVVINLPASLGTVNFAGSVILNGISPDNVIFNVVVGSNLSGGIGLTITNNNLTTSAAQGIFLNPNGPITINGNSNIVGRVFGGDSQSFQFNGVSNLTALATPVTPTLSTTPNPTSITLGSATPVLKDSATLAGGNAPTGTVTFTLFYNGGATPVDTETVPVNGNGTYTTPTGFTLPTTGIVVGTYQWNASYGGDSGNNPVSDNNAANEQVTVTADQIAGLTGSGATQTVNEGGTTAPITGIATFTNPAGAEPVGYFTATISWGDGTTSTGTVVSTGGGSYRVDAPTHTYADEDASPFPVTVTVAHQTQPPLSVTGATITVNEVQLTNLTGGGATQLLNEGGVTTPIGGIATFTDPAGAEPVGDYTATIDWGDGTTSPGTVVNAGGNNFRVDAPSHLRQRAWRALHRDRHRAARVRAGPDRHRRHDRCRPDDPQRLALRGSVQRQRYRRHCHRRQHAGNGLHGRQLRPHPAGRHQRPEWHRLVHQQQRLEHGLRGRGQQRDHVQLQHGRAQPAERGHGPVRGPVLAGQFQFGATQPGSLCHARECRQLFHHHRHDHRRLHGRQPRAESVRSQL
jgi:hypothetical protein